MPGPVTDDELTKIRELHAEGKTCRQIADALDRSPSTISTHAEKLGLSFEREQTEKATRAKQIDNAARRANIIEWQYERCQTLAERLGGEKFKTTSPTQFGLDSIELDFVPTGDELNLARAMSSYLQSAERLEKVDAGSGSDHALSEIGKIGAALAAAAEALSGDAGA